MTACLGFLLVYDRSRSIGSGFVERPWTVVYGSRDCFAQQAVELGAVLFHRVNADTRYGH